MPTLAQARSKRRTFLRGKTRHAKAAALRSRTDAELRDIARDAEPRSGTTTEQEALGFLAKAELRRRRLARGGIFGSKP